MDVLEFWRPTINWTGFDQGPISDAMWNHFRNVVMLCHACEHWKAASNATRLAPPRSYVGMPESKGDQKRRKSEWKRSIDVQDGHMHRAAFLAGEQIALMSYLLTDDDKDTSDWKLYFSLRGAVAHQLPHDQARYRAAAFKSFHAAQELENDPADIALRWLRQSGLAQKTGPVRT
ncbi:hypothetical protein JJE66_28115 [Bradyrhizobium diazoefficiens]|uniref:hypothetical protein n=1 Tax=Bradyrhizobium diazoefficiens TaxID=1355477 RepID=UPI0019096E41|nr:hypothetical protein [Bradyrhizobium diazoefficiens]MBK3665085.1 hypothetical protein [Bradyrhizobium diazoefficiens]